MDMPQNIFDITQLIQQEALTTYFQPIISLKNGAVIGLEALSRGLCKENNTIISPLDMFQKAREQHEHINLDRLCRKKAMESFHSLPRMNDLILFLNLEASIFQELDESKPLFTCCSAQNYNIKPGSVVVELVESKIENLNNLERIIKRYKDAGILVALDDFGAEYSNLKRIVLAKPDIIKIDRSLIHKASEDHYQRSIISSIKELSDKIGSLTLAEGVEREDDIHVCYELGIDLFQGFYFSKPKKASLCKENCCKEQIQIISEKLKNNLEKNIREQNRQNDQFAEIVDVIEHKLAMSSINDSINAINKSIEETPCLECIYMLDKNGIQIGPTFKAGSLCTSKNKLFSFSQDGSDHSLKNYFAYLKNLNLEKYFTDPYISHASGKLCRTISKKTSIMNKEIILCMDFVVKEMADSDNMETSDNSTQTA